MTIFGIGDEYVKVTYRGTDGENHTVEIEFIRGMDIDIWGMIESHDYAHGTDYMEEIPDDSILDMEFVVAPFFVGYDDSCDYFFAVDDAKESLLNEWAQLSDFKKRAWANLGGFYISEVDEESVPIEDGFEMDMYEILAEDLAYEDLLIAYPDRFIADLRSDDVLRDSTVAILDGFHDDDLLRNFVGLSPYLDEEFAKREVEYWVSGGVYHESHWETVYGITVSTIPFDDYRFGFVVHRGDVSVEIHPYTAYEIWHLIQELEYDLENVNPLDWEDGNGRSLSEYFPVEDY